MPDVSNPGYSEDAIWLRSIPGALHAMYGTPTDPGHRTGRRVGTLGHVMQCQGCGTICMPKHEPMTLTDNATGVTRTIPGAWVGPPDDPYGHFFPFKEPSSTDIQVNTDPQPATPSAAPRPAGIRPGAPRRSRSTPSRSPEARHAEYVRAKRRRRL